MKVKFNFNISIKPKQTRSPSNISYSVIEPKAEGIIKILEDLTFRVEYNGKLYKITKVDEYGDILLEHERIQERTDNDGR